MKIVLATLNAKYIHASLALRYLRAYARKDFPDIDLCEYTIKDPPLQVAADIYEHHPDVVGFSCYIWNIEATLQIVQILRKILPHVLIVLGGPEVSYDAEEWLERNPAVDIIVRLEGEKTFHHILMEYQGEQRWERIPGIAYRHPVRGVQLNPSQGYVDLATLPSPYDDEELPALRDRIVYFECSRGCPFSCAYCLSSLEQGVRYFPLDRTLRELKRLIDAGVKTIKFVDRTFNIHRRYALAVFDFLIRHHRPGNVFQFEITADILKPDVVQFLADHAPPGLFRFEIGVQSTNEQTNALVQRKQNWEKLVQTVLNIKKTGKIAQHLDLIAGLPREDYTSFRKTFNDVFALEPEELQLGFLKMLRGTGVRQEAKEYGYIYMEQPPYEILGNDMLPYSDLLRIKRVEDVLDKYWNAHRADRTLRFLIAEEFPSPFDFFQAFGDYWKTRGWNRIGYQLSDLFCRLKEFLEDHGSPHGDVALGLMKMDYLQGFSVKPRSIWWERSLKKEETQRLLRRLAVEPLLLGEEFAALGWGEQELHKHCLLETVPFDPRSIDENTGRVGKKGEQHLLVACYGGTEGRGPRFFYGSLEKMYGR